MAKFNKNGIAPLSVTTTPNATTFEGAPSFKMEALLELYQTVCTTLFGEPKFYEGKDARANRITKLVHTCVEQGHSEFVAKLAIYARDSMNLRSVPIFLTVTLLNELRKVEKASFGKSRQLVSRVIKRADEIREMFAAGEQIFGDKNDNKVFKRQAPKALLKGIGDAFDKFDAYQFKKYSGGNGSVSFNQVMRVVHPIPTTEEKSDLYRMIMEGTLPQINTWETEISTKGSNKDNWQNIADSKETGYMAKLRNLRNFTEHGVDMSNVIKHLTNPTAVANSKQLPFRFYTAYRELGGSGLTHRYYYGSEKPAIVASADVLTALEDAFDLSVSNLPDLGDDVLIVVDQSGSMMSPISQKSTVTCAEIAAVLGSAVWFNQTVVHGKKAMVAGFADRGHVYTGWTKRTSALAAAKQIMNTNLGGATRVDTAWNAAKKAGLNPSTIVVLSDMQMTGSYGYNDVMNPEQYGLVSKDTFKLSVNLQGYETTPFAVNNGWYQIAGWSEKIFDLATALRKPGEAIKLIQEQIDF